MDLKLGNWPHLVSKLKSQIFVSHKQVTRSIGDDDLKPAVTAEPEITETILSADDEYFVRLHSFSRVLKF